MYIILYLVSCNVTYVMEEKLNTDILYTVLSKHLIYEGFFKVIKKLCCCQTMQNTKVLHAMVVASGKV